MAESEVKTILFVFETDEPSAKQRHLSQIKRNSRIRGGDGYCRGVSLLLRNTAKVDNRKRDGETLFNLLNRLAINHGEAGSPSLVSAENLVEGLFERADVQAAGVMDGDGLVVKRKFRC